MSLNSELSDLFSTLAAIMDIRGENPFKAISFSKTSRMIKDLPYDIKECCDKGTLADLPGIGPGSKKIIEEYVKTGRSTDFDEVSASIPPGLIGMLAIPGLGPKTVALLWKERGVTTLEDLVKAIDEGKLAGLKGIGDKKIEQIKQGISIRSQAAQRMGIVEAQEIADSLVTRLRELPGVKRAEIAGSLRRKKETIGDVDLVACLNEPNSREDVNTKGDNKGDAKGDGSHLSERQAPARPRINPAGKPAETVDKTGRKMTPVPFLSAEAVGEAFTKFAEVEKILGQGATKTSVLTAGGLQVDLRIVPPGNFGAAWLYFTGSKDHNVKLRGLAQEKGFTLNEWGLYSLKEYEKAKKKTGEAPELKPAASKTEEDVYTKLGLTFVDPEIREDRGEVEAAQAKKLPKLITLADIRGDLHSHTTASDGNNSIEEMAEAAKSRGYEFLAITDHSKSQVIANGLSAERLLKHVEAIHKVGAKLKGITLLAGCEVDILVDGRLDFEDSVLKELDWVVASPHASLRQDSEKATARILRAIENRYVNIIGHPTGRLINRREGLPLDFTRIFKAAEQSRTALEINAGYPRLDLSDTNARGAILAGCILSINTDAHSIEGFEEIGAGVNVARRAWVEPKNVINCMSAKELLAWIKQKRG